LLLLLLLLLLLKGRLVVEVRGMDGMA